MNQPLSIYLHIPFCRHRCAYCDFNTYTGLGDLHGAYALALAEEIRQVGQAHPAGRWPVHTIFFGGGTPSLMAPPLLADILTAVHRSFALQPEAEISLEANPGTVDEAYLQAIREIGINRLSFGMQSADAGELAFLERQHGLGDVVAAVGMSRAAGFDNVNLDLIYGLPGQSLDSWERSLRAALEMRPEHLSLYCLTIEPGTRLQQWVERGRVNVPDPDLAADQYALACQVMATHGFVHYEISNWARSGQECQHNLTYWRNQEYLGFGAGAHGHAVGYRYHVVKQPRVYIRRIKDDRPGEYPFSAALAGQHRLDRREAISDTIITQLRLLQEGLDLSAFAAKFKQSIHDVYGETVGQLVDWGLLDQTGHFLRLTERGRFLSNQVFYRFL